MEDFNLWQKILDSDAVKRNLLPLQFLFGNREEASKFANEDIGKFAEGVMGATKPFRMGANILGQYGGSAITGQDMTQSENQGQFLKWLSEGITQQEQQELEEKPYLAALKSGVGMGSVFMPYASRAIPAASLGARTAQIVGRGLLEGAMGGFGYSREGKELEDTALGGALGVGGELIGNYAFDPSYRSMVNEGYGNISQGTYQGAVGNLAPNIEELRLKAYQAAGLNPEDISQMGQGLGVAHKNKYISDIELLQRGNKDPLVGEYLKQLRDQGLVDPGQVDMLLRLEYGIQPSQVDPTNGELFQEAGKYKTPQEFVEASFQKKPEYAMSHRPTWEGSPPASDLLEGDMLPRDVYDKPEWSISSGRNVNTDVSARESWEALLKIRNKPDAEVTVYRASPKGELNIGDWVTFSKNYAEGEGAYEGSKVFAHKVKAGDILFAGDDINEFGYFPRSKLNETWKQAHTKSQQVLGASDMSDDIFSPEGIDPGPGYVGSKSEKENSDTFLKILMGNEEDNNLLHNINVKESKRIPGRLAKDRSEDIKDEWRKTYGALLRKVI